MEKTLKIKLVKSLNGRLEKQITTAYSLGLKRSVRPLSSPITLLPVVRSRPLSTSLR